MNIQIVAPDTLWGETSWENYEKGKCGGTEATVLHVARELDSFGHSVSIGRELSGHHEVAIGINLALPEGCADHIYIDSHQAWSGIPPYIDGVFLRSYYHQTTQRSVNPDLDIDRCFIVGNGVDPDEWSSVAHMHQKDMLMQKDRYIWASSPERGLYHMLTLWPRIRDIKPNAELHIYYDVMRSIDDYRWGVSKMNLECQLIYEVLTTEDINTLGIYLHGMVPRAEFIAAMKSAEYLIYPCDPQFPSELFCITIAEALMARTKVVIPANVDALESLWKKYCVTIESPPIDEYPHYDINSAWLSAATTTEDIFPNPEIAHSYIQETYSWYNVAKRYEAVLSGESMDFGKPKLVIVPGIVE